MTLSTIWLTAFILQHPSFQYLIIFLGAAFGGELALFVLAFLAAKGILPIFPLIIVSFSGTFLSDLLWFMLGKTDFAQRIISHRYAHGTISVLTEAVERISRGNRFVALILAKFLVGTRVVLILYTSRTNLGLVNFVRYDAISVIIWLAVVIPIGLVSGFGFTYLAEVFHNLYVAIGFILLVMIIIVILQIWLEKKFTKKI